MTGETQLELLRRGFVAGVRAHENKTTERHTTADAVAAWAKEVYPDPTVPREIFVWGLRYRVRNGEIEQFFGNEIGWHRGGIDALGIRALHDLLENPMASSL